MTDKTFTGPWRSSRATIADVRGSAIQASLLAPLDLEATLGRNQHLVANGAERLPDQFFIHERPVGFGGVKERDARVNGCADDRAALFAARDRAVAVRSGRPRS